MLKKHDSTVQLFDLALFSGRSSDLLNKLLPLIENSSKTTYIVTPNPEQVIQARQDRELLRALEAADFAVPDGIGLIWASRLQHWRTGVPSLVERIPGVELAAELVATAASHGWPVLVLGGRQYGQPGQLLSQPGFTHVTWTPGYEDVTNPTPAEEKALANLIRQVKPRVLFVAFGAPHQELWLQKHRPLLESNHVRVAMVVGGAFDLLLGVVPRAPQQLRALGLEWLYRLVRQPWRWRRQLRLIHFVGLMIGLVLKPVSPQN